MAHPETDQDPSPGRRRRATPEPLLAPIPHPGRIERSHAPGLVGHSDRDLWRSECQSRGHPGWGGRYPLDVSTASTSSNADQVERLTVDAALGRGPSIEGADAKRLYSRLRREIKKNAKQGLAPDVPAA